MTVRFEGWGRHDPDREMEKGNLCRPGVSRGELLNAPSVRVFLGHARDLRVKSGGLPGSQGFTLHPVAASPLRARLALGSPLPPPRGPQAICYIKQNCNRTRVPAHPQRRTPRENSAPAPWATFLSGPSNSRIPATTSSPSCPKQKGRSGLQIWGSPGPLPAVGKAITSYSHH